MEIGKRAAIRKAILKNYGNVAKSDSSGCCGSGTSCCSPGGRGTDGQALGYSDEELASVPDGANLGLGCGNPQALAALKPGETVLDLGSGAGFDAFLASKRVGPAGKVVGVDMTPEMVRRPDETPKNGIAMLSSAGESNPSVVTSRRRDISNWSSSFDGQAAVSRGVPRPRPAAGSPFPMSWPRPLCLPG